MRAIAAAAAAGKSPFPAETTAGKSPFPAEATAPRLSVFLDNAVSFAFHSSGLGHGSSEAMAWWCPKQCPAVLFLLLI